MLRHFPKCQLIGDNVRTLDNAELLHLQCMLFLPTVKHLNGSISLSDAIDDYRRLFDDDELPKNLTDEHSIRNELLRSLRDDLLVSKQQFLSVRLNGTR